MFFAGTTFDSMDWPKDCGYYRVVREALLTGSMPYHVSATYHFTDRFLALPETNLSPQALLLRWVDDKTFAVLNVQVVYTVGFLGCLLLKRRFGLGLLSFTAFFLLYNFNGHIVSRLGVGHTIWEGYFLLSWLLLAVFALLEGERRAPVYLALVLFALMLQGSLHITASCVLFLVALGLGTPRLLRPVAGSLALAGVLSAWRILPTLGAFGAKHYSFQGGYETCWTLVLSLVQLRPFGIEPTLAPPFPEHRWTGWWELDLYVGVPAALALLGYGVVKRNALAELRYRELDVPLMVITFLSLGYHYQILAWLPLFNAERITSRFLILPFLFLLILAVARLDRSLPRRAWLAAVLVLLHTALMLSMHAALWRPARVDAVSGRSEYDRTVHLVRKVEPAYEAVVLTSLAGSSLALLGTLGWLALASRNATELAP